MEDWGSNFRKDDETSCEGGGGYYYLVGFERDGTNNLNGIKRAKCCARDQTFWNIPTQCQMPDWIKSLDGWVGFVKYTCEHFCLEGNGILEMFSIQRCR